MVWSKRYSVCRALSQRQALNKVMNFIQSQMFKNSNKISSPAWMSGSPSSPSIPLNSKKPLNWSKRPRSIAGLASAAETISAEFVGAVTRPPKVTPGRSVTSKLIFSLLICIQLMLCSSFLEYIACSLGMLQSSVVNENIYHWLDKIWKMVILTWTYRRGESITTWQRQKCLRI